MEIVEILMRATEIGLKVWPDGDCLGVEGVPTSEAVAVVEELKGRKPEVPSFLNNLNDSRPEWHAEQVARLVQKEGVCVFWAETFGEAVAFIKDETYLSAVPSGIVAYTEAELTELFGEDTAPKNQATWRLIREAKKFGLIVNNVREVE